MTEEGEQGGFCLYMAFVSECLKPCTVLSLFCQAVERICRCKRRLLLLGRRRKGGVPVFFIFSVYVRFLPEGFSGTRKKEKRRKGKHRETHSLFTLIWQSCSVNLCWIFDTWISLNSLWFGVNAADASLSVHCFFPLSPAPNPFSS